MRKDFPDITEKYKNYYFFYSGFLSNWFHSGFTDVNTGLFYDCTEQYMMHRKALLFNDLQIAGEVMAARRNPKECKNLGRKVKGFNPDVWNREARAIVYEGCYFKFSQNESLLKRLMSTQGSLLVEASPFDKVWGIGMSSNEAGVNDPRCWRGKNWLGQVLTFVRDDFAEMANTLKIIYQGYE